jgi:hypothetical protein
MLLLATAGKAPHHLRLRDHPQSPHCRSQAENAGSIPVARSLSVARSDPQCAHDLRRRPLRTVLPRIDRRASHVHRSDRRPTVAPMTSGRSRGSWGGVRKLPSGRFQTRYRIDYTRYIARLTPSARSGRRKSSLPPLGPTSSGERGSTRMPGRPRCWDTPRSGSHRGPSDRGRASCTPASSGCTSSRHLDTST